MMKMRVQLTKGEPIRYISHLDYARAIERAIRRAKLPAAYSAGFNPHMKIAFASALAVGVTSRAEYMDIELTAEMTPVDFQQQLAAQLPPGIELKDVTAIDIKQAALMASVNCAAYSIAAPLRNAASNDAVADSVAAFNTAAAVIYTKHTPKGLREIDVKTYMAQPVAVSVADAMVKLQLLVKIMPTGSIKPTAVLDVLVQQFELPVVQDAAIIERDGLYVAKDGQLLSPLAG